MKYIALKTFSYYNNIEQTKLIKDTIFDDTLFEQCNKVQCNKFKEMLLEEKAIAEYYDNTNNESKENITSTTEDNIDDGDNENIITQNLEVDISIDTTTGNDIDDAEQKPNTSEAKTTNKKNSKKNK